MTSTCDRTAVLVVCWGMGPARYVQGFAAQLETCGPAVRAQHSCARWSGIWQSCRGQSQHVGAVGAWQRRQGRLRQHSRQCCTVANSMMYAAPQVLASGAQDATLHATGGRMRCTRAVWHLQGEGGA